MVQDKISRKVKWVIRKYANRTNFESDKPFEVKEVDGNLLLNEGKTALQNLLIGNTETAFDSLNAYLGVGDNAAPAWTASTAYAVGDRVEPSVANGLIYECTVAGTSGTAEPTWPTTEGATVVDGTVTWTAHTKTEDAVQTGLLGANRTYKGMDTGYPTISGDTTIWKATFTELEANHAWQEFTVANGADDTATNLNRKVSDQGTKASGQVWTLELHIQWT